MTVPATKPTPGEVIESVLIQGDLEKLTAQQRSDYYMRVCESLGLNPLTKPFEYVRLSGKLQLYARKDCTDQLRKIHGISLKLVSKDVEDSVLTVHAHAHDRDGREDEDLGSVSFVYPERFRDRNGDWRAHPKAGKPFDPEDRANAVLKCVTKAKRRVTLSICGLGFFDEGDIEDMGAELRHGAPRVAPNVMLGAPEGSQPPLVTADPAASAEGIPDTAPDAEAATEAEVGGTLQGETDAEVIHRVEPQMKEAATRGTAALKELWETLPLREQRLMHVTLDRVYKPKAQAVDIRLRAEARAPQKSTT